MFGLSTMVGRVALTAEGGAVMYDYSEFWLFLNGTIIWTLTMYGFVLIGRWLKRK